MCTHFARIFDSMGVVAFTWYIAFIAELHLFHCHFILDKEKERSSCARVFVSQMVNNKNFFAEVRKYLINIHISGNFQFYISFLLFFSQK